MLATDYSGAWTDASTFTVTILTPDSSKGLSTGADYSVGCAQDAIFLREADLSSPAAPSASCCDASYACKMLGATGTFGALKQGPKIDTAVADDEDDGDDAADRPSAGDIVVITFDLATSAPAKAGDELFEFVVCTPAPTSQGRR